MEEPKKKERQKNKRKWFVFSAAILLAFSGGISWYFLQSKNVLTSNETETTSSETENESTDESTGAFDVYGAIDSMPTKNIPALPNRVKDNVNVKNDVKGNNWMGCLRDDVNIYDLSIPGTHDTCTFEGKDGKYLTSKILGIKDVEASPFIKTQDEDILKQLNEGNRYQDVRADGLNTCHGDSIMEITVPEVLDIYCDFLDCNPGEVIIMRIDGGISNEQLTQLFKDHPRYANHFWVNNNKTVSKTKTDSTGITYSNIAPKLGEARGKIVVYAANATQFVVNGVRYGLVWAGPDTKVQDDYNGPSVTDKVAQVLAICHEANEDRTKTMFFNHLSATPGLAGKTLDVIKGIAIAAIDPDHPSTIYKYAEAVYPHFQNDLLAYRDAIQKTGTIIYDYTGTVCNPKIVYMTNF